MDEDPGDELRDWTNALMPTEDRKPSIEEIRSRADQALKQCLMDRADSSIDLATPLLVWLGDESVELAFSRQRAVFHEWDGTEGAVVDLAREFALSFEDG